LVCKIPANRVFINDCVEDFPNLSLNFGLHRVVSFAHVSAFFGVEK